MPFVTSNLRSEWYVFTRRIRTFQRRFFLGVLNGLMAISKTMISEVCGKEHEMVGMGSMLGDHSQRRIRRDLPVCQYELGFRPSCALQRKGDTNTPMLGSRRRRCIGNPHSGFRPSGFTAGYTVGRCTARVLAVIGRRSLLLLPGFTGDQDIINMLSRRKVHCMLWTPCLSFPPAMLFILNNLGCGSIGLVIGPGLGGLLAKPAIHYPTMFSASGLFGRQVTCSASPTFRAGSIPFWG